MPAARPGACSVHLTRREAQVLDLLATGLSDLEIAEALGLARHSVTGLVTRAAAKLQVNSDKTGHRIVLATLWQCELFRIGAGKDDRSGWD